MPEWPYRWDLLARYRVIEIVAKWEGRLTTNHLINSFGIGRQQASKDINNYLRDVAPGNLEYDKRLKGYKPTSTFSPMVTAGQADEYLLMLSRSKDITTTFGLQLRFSTTEIIQAPIRNIDPAILRPLVQAMREKKRVDIGYVSLSAPDEEGRIITPHTLVCTPMRWHIRAHCEKNGDYRDFVLSRFSDAPEIMGASEHSAEDDPLWNKSVEIVIEPDPRLDKAQRAIVAKDFGMERNRLRINTRAALAHYMVQSLNIDPFKLHDEPKAQQIVIKNIEKIRPFLYA
ncbi:Uncharacterised protein [BD1-7 clade bacterium]|nr:Uncharacterised protein [BD1-7 clade bacterium]